MDRGRGEAVVPKTFPNCSVKTEAAGYEPEICLQRGYRVTGGS